MSALTRTHRRPFLTPIWLLIIAVTTVIALFLLAVWWLFAAPSTVLVIAAPAEVEGAGTPDALLSASGQARADRLAQMLGGAADRLEAIDLVPAPGARATAAPLAARLGLVPRMLPAADAPQLARRILREHRGGRVLLIAPAELIPRVLDVLAPGSTTADAEGAMYIVTSPTLGQPTELRLSY